MPDSRIRNTRSASRRELAGDGLPGRALAARGRHAASCASSWPVAARHDVLLGRLGLGELGDQPALAHDQDPVGHAAAPRAARRRSSRWRRRSPASSASRWCTSALVPTSMPRVGSSTISTAGWRPSHLASTTFCWLPPDSMDTGSVSRPYLTCSRAAQSAASARSAEPRISPAFAQPAERGQRHVLLDRHVHDQALLAPVLGDEARPRRPSRRSATPCAAAARAP